MPSLFSKQNLSALSVFTGCLLGYMRCSYFQEFAREEFGGLYPSENFCWRVIKPRCLPTGTVDWILHLLSDRVHVLIFVSLQPRALCTEKSSVQLPSSWKHDLTKRVVESRTCKTMLYSPWTERVHGQGAEGTLEMRLSDQGKHWLWERGDHWDHVGRLNIGYQG